MKNITLGTFILTFALLSANASAGSCPNDMKQIDAAMAGSSLSAADMETVKKLRAEGERRHKSGDHTGSVAALDEAKEMLGI